MRQGDLEEQVTGMACDWSCEWSGEGVSGDAQVTWEQVI